MKLSPEQATIDYLENLKKDYIKELLSIDSNLDYETKLIALKKTKKTIDTINDVIALVEGRMWGDYGNN